MNYKKACIITGLLIMVIFSLIGCQNESGTKKEPEENLNNSVIIYDENDICIRLIACKDFTNGSLVYLLEGNSEYDCSKIWIDLDDFIINDELNITYSYLNVEKGIPGRIEVPEMSRCLAYLDHQIIEKISFHLTITNGDTYQSIDEKEIDLEVTDKLIPQIVCEPFMGANAKEQVLIDREDLKVTLLGCGHYLSGDTYDDSLTGKLLFENKSKNRIPIGVSALNLNGYTVDISGYGEYLDPDTNQFVDFEISNYDYEKFEISKLTSLELMIITDEKEMDNYYDIVGGSWYPVELSIEDAESEKENMAGDMIYSSNDVEIYYLGQDIERYINPDEGSYWWEFLIVNNSDEDISVSPADVGLNGILEESMDSDKRTNYRFISQKVGAHSKTTCQIEYNYKNTEPRPTISFTIMIKSFSGGTLIDKGEDLITIEPRPEEDCRDSTEIQEP